MNDGGGLSEPSRSLALLDYRRRVAELYRQVRAMGDGPDAWVFWRRRRDDLFRSRHSQVTHVFFEGCRYWTPMKSRGLEVCWREPEFIPKSGPPGDAR